MDRFLLVFLSIACFSKSFTQTPANLDLSFRLTSKTLGYINGFSCQKHGKSIVTSDVAANYGNNKSWHIVRLDTSGQFYSTFDFASYSNLATSYAFPNTMFTPLTKVLAARCSNTPANMSGYYFKPIKHQEYETRIYHFMFWLVYLNKQVPDNAYCWTIV